jgi:hypothetical protein
MEIIRHLSNEELADLVIESDRQALRQTFEALPGWARAATERDEEFWQNQRTAVWSRISSAEERSARRLPILAWALAGVMIAVSGWLLNRPLVVPPPQEVRVASDHELLMEVERVVQIDGPLALEPAALLAEEMVQDLPAKNSSSHKKETNHEN